MAPEITHLQDRDWLVEQYVGQSKSARAIARELGCSLATVTRALRWHDIELRPRTSQFPLLQDKGWLREQYIDNRLSAKSIAKLVGSTPGNVYSHLRLAEIPTRPLRESLPRDENGKALRVPSATRAESIRRSASRLRGRNHPSWTGGRFKMKEGYVKVYAPDHPRATAANPYVLEHVLVMEEAIGRYIDSAVEVVHHKNHIKDDNRLENLELKPRKAHTREHWEEGRSAAEAKAEAKRLRRILDEHGIDYS